MNIPLDNLYHWIQSVAQHHVMLYVFQPHGSKDIFDLSVFSSDYMSFDHYTPLDPSVVCHDQEPLDFDLYKFEYDPEKIDKLILKYRNRYVNHTNIEYNKLTEQEQKFYRMFYTNLSRWNLHCASWLNFHSVSADWTILLHSELNSKDVEQFSNARFRPVYYWSHAIISRDWFRFAQHDKRLQQKSLEKTFLVYCRDWTPIREYRLKFLDLLLSAGLENDCKISTQHVTAHGVHLIDYQIQDPRFNIDKHALLTIPENNTPSWASADYDAKDYRSTAVSIVLETVFDDKIHLTEKTLRPLACRHAFVLAAGPGSLKYLRNYGFKTFGHIFDESYDDETDAIKRLEKIISTMKQIQCLTPSQWQEINEIVNYNQQHFFSQDFFDQVANELNYNLNEAIAFCLENRGQTWWQVRKYARSLRILQTHAKSNAGKKVIRIIRSLRLKNRAGPISR